jgi:Predicted phosphohydrolases
MWTLAIIIFIGLIIALYGYFIEPDNVRLKTIKIRNILLATTFSDFKIVLISDLHIGDNWSTAATRALKIINKIKPDLILLTGDYLRWKGKKSGYDNAINYLSHLNASSGVYAVMGDSDCFVSTKSCELCHKEGRIFPKAHHKVKFLSNSQVTLENKGKKFTIFGMKMNSRDTANLGIAQSMSTNTPNIILSHSSLIYCGIDANKNVLVLSGDTHGGQVYLPGFIWKIIKIKPDPEHMYGLYQDKNKILYVTSGIGTSAKLPMRIGVPPEVVLFKFNE